MVYLTTIPSTLALIRFKNRQVHEQDYCVAELMSEEGYTVSMPIHPNDI